MRKSQFLLLVFVLIFGMLFVACGGGAEEAAPEEISEPAQEAISEELPPAEEEETPEKLTMWTWKNFHIPGLEAVAASYFEETGIQVEFEAITPDDAYRTRIQTAAQSGELPDMLMYWGGAQFEEVAAGGLLVNIADQVGDEWANSFLPGTFESTSVWTQTRYDNCQANVDCIGTEFEVGDIFSVPFTVGSFGIVYLNKSMLEEAGIDPNIVPADSEEFLDILQQVQEATGKGATIGGQFSDIIRNWVVDDLAMTNCGVEEYVAMYNGEEGASFTSECALQAYGFVGQLAERNLWNPGFQALTIDEADISFAQGDAAALFGGSFTLGFLLQQGMAPEDIHIITLPALPTSQQNPIALSPFSLIDVGVTTQSEAPNASLDFIRYLTSPEGASLFASITGDLPGAKISTDPAVVGEMMASLAGSYGSSSEAYRATDAWSNGRLAGSDVATALDLAANHQVTGESDLPSDMQAADETAAFDREFREGN